MNQSAMTKVLFATALLTIASAPLLAAPVEFDIDPSHTYPSFEADHIGISVWRGKFDKSSGKVTLDREKGTGTVDVTVDLDSVNFGLPVMNSWARGKDLFDTERFPPAVFRGKLEGFANGIPKEAVGTLSLHGITKPMTLKINQFKCIPHPLHKRELCGADLSATFNREDYGLDAGKSFGFKMEVTLRIQVEAVATK